MPDNLDRESSWAEYHAEQYEASLLELMPELKGKVEIGYVLTDLEA